MAILLAIVVYLLLFSLGEVAYRRWHIAPESTRRFVHASAGLLAASLFTFFTREQIIILSAAFFGGLLLSRHLSLLQSLHKVKRGGIGELLFPVGVMLGAFLFLPQNRQLYQESLLILAISDPLASWIGSRFASQSKQQTWPKSWQGSTAFFVFAFLVASVGQPIFVACIIALAATFAEYVTPYGFDNVTIIGAIALAATGFS